MMKIATTGTVATTGAPTLSICHRSTNKITLKWGKNDVEAQPAAKATRKTDSHEKKRNAGAEEGNKR